MKKRLKKYIGGILVDESQRTRIQMIIVTVLLSAIGLAMFFVNIYVREETLVVITGIFSLLNIIAVLMLVFLKTRRAPSVIVSVSTAVMFTELLITGGIDGFSPIWLCLLPSTGMFFLGMKRGAGMSAVMLVIIILVFWTPFADRIPYRYTDTFLIRFPIVYVGCFIIAYSIEYARETVYEKMREAMGQLDELGKTDDLTKIYNRRYFNEKLGELWEIVSRAHGQLSMLMIDVDYFKPYNDHYGHLMGDKVLAEVAGAITGAVCMNNDIAARWGGEEFVVLMPLTDERVSVRLAEDMIDAVRKKGIPHELTSLAEKYVTISVGVGSIFPGPAYPPVKLIELADESLYDAKKHGRNRAGAVMFPGSLAV